MSRTCSLLFQSGLPSGPNSQSPMSSLRLRYLPIPTRNSVAFLRRIVVGPDSAGTSRSIPAVGPPAGVACVAVEVKQDELAGVVFLESGEEFGVADFTPEDFFVENLALNAHEATESAVPVGVGVVPLGGKALGLTKEEDAGVFVFQYLQAVEAAAPGDYRH